MRAVASARRWPVVTAACIIVASAGLVACGGDTAQQPTWQQGHPDTSLLSFETTAPGVCAITVQYPLDAPAAIGYLGSSYVQVSRRPRPSTSGGRSLGRSGDWQTFLQPGGDLVLVTGTAAFDYRFEAGC